MLFPRTFLEEPDIRLECIIFCFELPLTHAFASAVPIFLLQNLSLLSTFCHPDPLELQALASCPKKTMHVWKYVAGISKSGYTYLDKYPSQLTLLLQSIVAGLLGKY